MNYIGVCVFSLCLILGSGATCPHDPQSMVKKCGEVFHKFGDEAHQDITRLRAMCPQVYRALDCLRDISKECRLFHGWGLAMADNDYEQEKAFIDAVCEGVGPGAMLPECKAKIFKCGAMGANLLLVSSYRRKCSILKRQVSCYEDFQEDCEIVPTPETSAILDNVRLNQREVCSMIFPRRPRRPVHPM